MLRHKCSEHVLERIQSLVSPERGVEDLGWEFGGGVEWGWIKCLQVKLERFLSSDYKEP